MEEGDNDPSANAVNLNSPEVSNSGCPSFLPEDKDQITRLKASFTQEGTSGILSKDIKNKNESRRVSFPEDDKIISGYGEPRNPWAHAKTTSTEELIQAYTQSCQQWGVKPITKLLVQLQEIRDFSVRAHSLTLKGEKLDTKVVETLEAVFKRVQFVIMDLEATNLDDDSAAALFDMIEYYESAVNVLVGFNRNLGTRGWQAAAHMMRKMSCLRLFDGHSVPLSDQAVPFVGRALRLSNTLVTLHLECATLSGRPMLLIVAALRMNVTLKELFLADNQLVSTDALQIANLLKFNSVLQLLDVRNNMIQDAGLFHLCSGLMSQPQNQNPGGLQTLVLWNNQISHQSMAKLAMALRYTASLSTLNLGQNVLGDDGASKLKDGLLQNHSLLRLGMVGTKLSCEGAIALAEYLAESGKIIRLDLRNNDIRVGGLMALGLAFKINFSLLRLDVDKPNSKETLKELVDKQDSLLEDMVEYASRNKQKAIEKVFVQMERQKKSDEEKQRAGLRYMDMTNSAVNAGASTSQNNSNNKPPPTSTDLKPPKVVLIPPSDVDDSPMNSPEMLPANSVSYHQVSPVMFSSSEMQKRAEMANEETDDVKEDAGDASNSISENQKSELIPDTAADDASELQCRRDATEDTRGDEGADDTRARDANDTSSPRQVSEEAPESRVEDAETKGNTSPANTADEHVEGHVRSKKTGSHTHSHTSSKLFKVECVDHDVTSCENSKSGDVSSSDHKCGDVIADETTSSDVEAISSDNLASDTGDVRETNHNDDDSLGENCDVAKQDNKSGDAQIDNSDVTSDLKTDETDLAVANSEASVTVTHFDLSLFPSD